MDFGLEDPLESDDSFFEEPKALTRKPSASRASAKKSVEDLFGFDDKNKGERESKAKGDGSDAGMARQKPRDFLDLGEKKTDFLEDLLSVKSKGGKLEKKVDSLEDILKDASKPATPIKDPPKPAPDASDFNLFSTASRRRSKKPSTGLEDSLGILGDDFQSGDYFSAKDKKDILTKQSEDFQKPKSAKEVPNWLGGTAAKQETIQKPPEVEIITNATQQKEPETLNPQQINMGIQNTYSSLHQQESFLLLTLQMKKYEESLNEIKNLQRNLMEKQEKQMGHLMEEYLLKQKVMENNVRLQQERINSQIQMIMMQSGGNIEREEKGDVEDQSLLKILKQRHDEEMFLMEESYKKQINFLESSNQLLEDKLKNELETITKTLEEKINNVKEQYENELTFYKGKASLLEEQHQNEVKILKENHLKILDEMKNDHAIQLEYFKQMKQNEVNLMGNSENFSQKINAGIELLVNNAQTLNGLEEKVLKNYEVLSIARENSIQTKEKEVIMMRSTLEKCRQEAENERSQLMSLIRNLETKLAEQSHNSSEDRWALQQASATLTARAAALEREAEYHRNVLEREREQLKTLKESLLEEQERLIMNLTEEKLQLNAEKAKLDVAKRLTNTYEVEKVKTEAEVAVAAARELTEKVHRERSYLLKQKNELDAMKKHLFEREKELDDREAELEALIQSTQKKLQEDRNVLVEAKMIERNYKERLQELQQQRQAIGNREKRLAQEKVLLSKERLELYTAMKSNKGCALCKSDAKSVSDVQADKFQFQNLDPDGLRLRFEIEDERESEVSREDNLSAK